MKNLCANVILGLDFMKLHSKVNFEMNGSKSAISIDNLCNVLTANIEPPGIFRSISSDCVPVATKSRSYGESDKKFIEEEVVKLLEQWFSNFFKKITQRSPSNFFNGSRSP